MRPGIVAVGDDQVGRACRASVSPSSAERAPTAIETSSPAKVMAKAFWIVTLSSAIRIRFAMVIWKYHLRNRGSMRTVA